MNRDKEFKQSLTNEKIKDYIMPFGKYQKEKLDNIPITYLDWLVGQKWLKEPVKSIIEDYLNDPVLQKELESELNQEEEEIEY